MGNFMSKETGTTFQPAGEYLTKAQGEAYQPKGEYQPAGEYLTKAQGEAYQPKGDYLSKVNSVWCAEGELCSLPQNFKGIKIGEYSIENQDNKICMVSSKDTFCYDGQIVMKK